MYTIKLENLTKIFGRGKRKVEAVRSISLEIEPKQVYGLLGPNGAGKTTTIRMILDLIRPTSGDVQVFGQSVRNNLPVLRRVGAMVEGAAMYPYLTGRRNLEVLARTFGEYDAANIQRLLEQVNMADRADRKFGGYSTGMKQRMGLAATLLHDPELIILDEPTNGLDPAGIQEMRYFIRDLVDNHNKTVLLSSHMLNEVEQICDRVAIINKGQVVQEGRVADLLKMESVISVTADPVDRANEILQGKWTVSQNGTDALYVHAAYTETPEIVKQLVAHDLSVYEIKPHKQSLEEFFLRVTKEGA